MSNGKLFELKMPKFLLAVEPAEMPRGFHYIYSPHYLSLVLVVRESTQLVIFYKELLDNFQKTYTFKGIEQFRLVMLQNNVEAIDEEVHSPVISVDRFLDEAWEWYQTNMIK